MEKFDGITLGEWLARWYRVYKEPYLSESSLNNIKMVIRLHIPDDMKQTQLDEITPYMIEDAIADVTAPRMRQYTWQVFHAAFDMAALHNIIERDPMRLVPKVKHKQKIGNSLSPLEIKEFKHKIRKHPLRDLFEFYLYTGCRRSEALTVTKYDIDTVSMTLRIRGTKSKTSDRVMPISKPLEYVINRVITSADPYLFHVTGDYVSRAFKALCPNHKLHDLRHTFATHCLQCGVSMKVLQLWLGHASFETTASIYTHVVDAFQRTEASKIAWF